jgi:hypothetical protein
VIGAAFLDQAFRLRLRPHVIEDDAGASGGKHTHRRRANSARTSRNQCDISCDR